MLMLILMFWVCFIVCLLIGLFYKGCFTGISCGSRVLCLCGASLCGFVTLQA